MFSTPPGRPTRPGPELSVIVATCIICMLIAAIGVWQDQQSRSLRIFSHREEASNLAKGLAQHTHDEIQAADHILVSVRETIERQGSTLQNFSPSTDITTIDANKTSTLKEVSVYGADGQLISKSLPNSLEHNNISNYGYFQYHRIESGRGLKIGVPTHSQSDGRWVVTLSRRIDSMGGDFTGLVVATISIDKLERLYGSFDVGVHGIIALVSADGIILARHPSDSSLIGADVSGGSFFRSIKPQVPGGDCDYSSTIDGIHRIGSYRHLEDSPLIVVVAFDLKEALGSWDLYARGNITASLVGMIIVIILGILVSRRLKRRMQVEGFLRLLASHSHEAVMCVGEDGRCLYATPAFNILTQCSIEIDAKQHWNHFIHPEDRKVVENTIKSLSYGSGQETINYRYVSSRGSSVWVEASLTWLPIDKNSSGGFIINIKDINAQSIASQTLASSINGIDDRANSDNLNDLPDRSIFDKMLNQEWARAARTSQPISLLLIQVDCPWVNKTDHSLQKENRCLQAVALAIRRSALRPGDFAGRYGKEEFALILTDTERGGASVVATRILVAIETLGKDYFSDMDDFRSTVTIGFATTHPSHKDLKTSSTALSVAVDVAVYEAKLSGTNQIIIYNNHTASKKGDFSAISYNTQTYNDILA